MIVMVQIGTNKIKEFSDLRELCDKMKWNYRYLKTLDLRQVKEYKGYYIQEKQYV